MMTPNELRIGNYVQTTDPVKRIGRVIRFSNKTVELKMKHSTLKRTTHPGMKGLDVEPVLLTPEIITNLGFITKFYGDDYFSIEVNGKELLYIRAYYTGGYIWGLGDFPTNKSFEYDEPRVLLSVSDLQNLYSSLSGKELTMERELDYVF